MSLGVGIKGPEGIVIAAESRVTLENNQSGKIVYSTYDNATKILSFKKHNYVGVVTYGLATIGQRTAHGFIPEFESQIGDTRLTIKDFSQKLSDFYMSQWNSWTGKPNPYLGSPMVFTIAGFDDGEPYGKIYEVLIPSNPTPVEKVTSKEDDFQIIWGGQREIVDRILQGIDPLLLTEIENTLGLTSAQKQQLKQILPKYVPALPLNVLALQDCVDLAIFLIRSTIDAQKSMASLRGCGGPIDVAIITRGEGLKYIQKKKITGDQIDEK